MNCPIQKKGERSSEQIKLAAFFMGEKAGERMAELDSLSISIAANSKNASTALNGLISSLEGLSRSLNVDTRKLSSVSEGIRGLSNSLSGLGKDKSSGILSLATALTRLNNVNVDSIHSLSTAMKNLSETMSATGTADISGIVNAVNDISKLGSKSATMGAQNLLKIKDDLISFAQGLNQIGAVSFDITGLIGVINSISRLGNKMSTQATQNLPTISRQFQEFVRQLNQIGALRFDVSNLANLTNAISRLGGKAATNAVNTIPRLTSALQNMMSSLSRAPTVSRNLIDMTSALANLASQGNRVGSTSRGLISGLNGFSVSAKSARKQAFSLASAFGKLYASYWLVFRAISKIGDAINIASDLTEVQNVVSTTFGDMAYKVNDFAENSIQQFGMSELALKTYASRFQAMGTAMGIGSGAIEKANRFLNRQTDGYVELSDSMSDVSLNLTKLAADMASFYNVEQDVVAEDLAAIFTGQTRPLRDYGLDLTEATLKEWAMKQGLDANIDSMSQAEKTMLRYQYVLSNTTASQGDFARTADTWANQVRILKQSFEELGSIVGGALINVFKPFLQTLNVVLQRVIAFAEDVVNALGAIFGWTIEINSAGVVTDLESAADSSGDIASGMGEAADNAKKLKQYMLGFDELHVISPAEAEQGASSGSGGGGSSVDITGDTGGGLQIDFKDAEGLYQSDIKNLEELGEFIGDSLKNVLENIDWDEIYKKAENFGEGLANFLNGLISPELFYNLGATIAGALNTALHFLDSFGRTFDWTNFGESVGAGINGFFENFDFALLADTLNVWAKGILDAMIKALQTADWYMIGQQIGTFLAKVDWTGILSRIGKLIWEAIKAAVELWSGSFSIAPLETVIISLAALPGIIKKIKASKLAKDIKKLVDNFKSLAGTATLAYQALRGNEESIRTLATNSPRLAKAINVLRDSFWALRAGVADGQIFTGISVAIENIRNNLSGFQKALIGIPAVIGEFVLVKDAFYDIASGSDNLTASLGKIAAGAGIAVGALKLIGMSNPFTAAIVGATALVSALIGIKQATEEIEAEQFGESIRNALSNPGGVPLSEISEMYAEAIGEIGNSFSIITEKSTDLQQADKNIQSTWLEIEKIETAMEAGTISVEEGTKKLTEQFGILAQTAQDKFSTLEDTLLVAFGENGVLAGVYERLGISTEETTSQIIALNDKVEQRIEELVSLLSTTDPSNPNYAAYKEELAGLVGQTDELTTAVSDYQFALDQIDYSKLFNTDGTINTDALKTFLGEIKDAVENANKDIETAIDGIRTSLNEELNMAIAVGDTQSAEEIRTKLAALPDAMDLLKEDVSTKAKELTDTVQIDFLGSLDNVIVDAQSRWGEKGFLGQVWSGVAGEGSTEDEYVQQAVKKQQENINTLSAEIESSFEELGINGAGWAGEAAKEITNSIFDQLISSSDFDNTRTVELKSNWETILNTAVGDAAESIDAGTYAKSIVDGFNQGIEENKYSTESTVNAWMDIAETALRVSMEINSPSKKTYDYGVNTVEGYNEGIDAESGTTNTLISTWMAEIQTLFGTGTTSIVTDTGTKFSTLPGAISSKIAPFIGDIGVWGTAAYDAFEDVVSTITNSVTTWFGELPDDIYNSIESMRSKIVSIGSYIKDGIMEGMSSLKNSAKSFVNTLFEEIKTEAKIHSPSERARDEIGVYIGEGIAEGLALSGTTITEAANELMDDIESQFSKDKINIDLGVDFDTGYESGIALSDRFSDSYKYNSYDSNPTFESSAGSRKVLLDSFSQTKEDFANFSSEFMALWEQFKLHLQESFLVGVEATKTNFQNFTFGILSLWEQFQTHFSTGWVEYWNKVGEFSMAIFNSILMGFNNVIKEGIRGLNHLVAEANALSELTGETYRKAKNITLEMQAYTPVKGFYDGGFPNKGELFWANENGRAEMVGSIGGRTAVANNDQITTAIQNAVYSAIMHAMSNNANSQQPIEITSILELDGDTVYKNQQKVAARRGINFGLGQFQR